MGRKRSFLKRRLNMLLLVCLIHLTVMIVFLLLMMNRFSAQYDRIVSNISLAKGILYFLACMPMAIIGYWSALKQSRASIACIGLIAKRPDQLGKAIIFPAMVETYAILALLVSILAVTGIAGLPV